jgi:hypothetical protein
MMGAFRDPVFCVLVAFVSFLLIVWSPRAVHSRDNYFRFGMINTKYDGSLTFWHVRCNPGAVVT